MPLVHIKNGLVHDSDGKKQEKKKTSAWQEESFAFDKHSNSDNYRDTWRVFRIMAEFVEGYQFLAKFHNEVTVFGSARFKSSHAYYKKARELGELLAKGKYTTITGGGPGIMEAANRGAYEGGGESLGINIQLPFEQRINPYVKKSIAFHYFFTRKVMFATPAQAFVYFPGGFGTLDEFWEIIDLMCDGELDEAPIILVGREYWEPLLDWLPNNPAHTLTPKEKEVLASCHIVDSPKDALEIVKKTKDVPNICELSPDNYHCKDNGIHWRIFRIMSEMVEGFEFLTGVVKDVTVFGTRRVSAVNKHYKAAEKLGKLAAQAGFSLVTGGYKGIADAANRGAIKAGGESIGLYMNNAQKSGLVSKHLSKSLGFDFPFTRKFLLTAPSKGFVMFPGGLGTVHQTMEVLTLIQTGKMPAVPMILFGSEFWEPFADFANNILLKKFETINKKDLKLFRITDDPEEVIEIIKKEYNSSS